MPFLRAALGARGRAHRARRGAAPPRAGRLPGGAGAAPRAQGGAGAGLGGALRRLPARAATASRCRAASTTRRWARERSPYDVLLTCVGADPAQRQRPRPAGGGGARAGSTACDGGLPAIPVAVAANPASLSPCPGGGGARASSCCWPAGRGGAAGGRPAEPRGGPPPPELLLAGGSSSPARGAARGRARRLAASEKARKLARRVERARGSPPRRARARGRARRAASGRRRRARGLALAGGERSCVARAADAKARPAPQRERRQSRLARADRDRQLRAGGRDRACAGRRWWPLIGSRAIRAALPGAAGQAGARAASRPGCAAEPVRPVAGAGRDAGAGCAASQAPPPRRARPERPGAQAVPGTAVPDESDRGGPPQQEKRTGAVMVESSLRVLATARGPGKPAWACAPVTIRSHPVSKLRLSMASAASRLSGSMSTRS